MIRLRDVPLRTKLYALVIGYSVLVAGVLVLAGVLLRTYRVNGPVYDEIATYHRLTNDIEPAVLNIGIVYLYLQEVDSLTDPNDVRAAVEKVREFEAKYLESRAYWLSPGKLPDGDIRRGLETTAYTPAADVL